MTKPAAVFAQLFGALLAFLAIGIPSWVVGIVGVGLFILGGAASRKRIREDQGLTRPQP